VPNPSWEISIRSTLHAHAENSCAGVCRTKAAEDCPHSKTLARNLAKLLDCASPLALSRAMPCPRAKRHRRPDVRSDISARIALRKMLRTVKILDRGRMTQKS